MSVVELINWSTSALPAASNWISCVLPPLIWYSTIAFSDPENRTSTTREYFGNAADRESKGPHQPGKFRQSHKQQLKIPKSKIIT
mgnify:CR=1 FL=1